MCLFFSCQAFIFPVYVISRKVSWNNTISLSHSWRDKLIVLWILNKRAKIYLGSGNVHFNVWGCNSWLCLCPFGPFFSINNVSVQEIPYPSLCKLSITSIEPVFLCIVKDKNTWSNDGLAFGKRDYILAHLEYFLSHWFWQLY